MKGDVMAEMIDWTPQPIHPTEFIQDEMDERGWSRAELANRMGMDRCVLNKIELDMYFLIGPTDTQMRIGKDTADALSRAFDISADFFLNCEAAWLRDMGVTDRPAP